MFQQPIAAQKTDAAAALAAVRPKKRSDPTMALCSRAGWQPSSDDDSIEAMRRASDSYRDERNAWRSDARERSAMVEALEEISDTRPAEPMRFE